MSPELAGKELYEMFDLSEIPFDELSAKEQFFYNLLAESVDEVEEGNQEKVNVAS